MISSVESIGRHLGDSMDVWLGGEKTKPILAGVLICSGAYWLGKSIELRLWRSRLRQAVKELRQTREQQFDDLQSELNENSSQEWESRRNEILAMTMKELLASLQSNETTPTDALKAYQWKALQAQNSTNCICFFVEEANDQARQLELQFGDPEAVKPELYGLPISVKESIYVKGQVSTRGYAQSLLSPTLRASEDAVIVAQLRRLGAIPFCTTNVPQTLMSFTTSNPIYGTATHPLNNKRNPGGSSGGEAALIAFGGSLVGLGTDVAGSIRMPAHVSGIAALKPTWGRVSQLGMNSGVPGRPMAYASVGPMAQDAESVEIIMRALLNDAQLAQIDPYVSPIPFRGDIFDSPKPMKIGYYVTDGYFQSIPACRRAVLEAKQALEMSGHTLVQIAAPDMSEAIKFLIPIQFLDSGRYMGEIMSRDLVDPYQMAYYRMYQLPSFVKRLIGLIVKPVWPRISANYSHFAETTDQLRRVYGQANVFKTQLANSWLSLGLDGVICPVNAGVAHPHANHSTASMAAEYTAIFNILDYPGGVVPVTRVSQEDDQALETHYDTRDPLGRLVQQGNLDSKGLPVGVQCVSYPFREEMVLRMMRDIERHVVVGDVPPMKN